MTKDYIAIALKGIRDDLGWVEGQNWDIHPPQDMVRQMTSLLLRVTIAMDDIVKLLPETPQ